MRVGNKYFLNFTETDKTQTSKLIKDMTNDFHELTSFNIIDNIYESFINKSDKDKLIFFNKVSKIDFYEKCLNSCKLIRKPINKFHKDNMSAIKSFVLNNEQYEEDIKLLDINMKEYKKQEELLNNDRYLLTLKSEIDILNNKISKIQIRDRYMPKLDKSELLDIMNKSIATIDNLDVLNTKLSLTPIIDCSIEQYNKELEVCLNIINTGNKNYEDFSIESIAEEINRLVLLESKYNLLHQKYYNKEVLTLDGDLIKRDIEKLTVLLRGIKTKKEVVYTTPKYSIEEYANMIYTHIVFYNKDYIYDESILERIKDTYISDKTYTIMKYKYDNLQPSKIPLEDLKKELIRIRTELNEFDIEYYTDLKYIDSQNLIERKKKIIDIIGEDYPLNNNYLYNNESYECVDYSINHMNELEDLINKMIITDDKYVDLKKLEFLQSIQSNKLRVDLDKLIVVWNNGDRSDTILDDVGYVLNNFKFYTNKILLNEIDLIKDNIEYNKTMNILRLKRNELSKELNAIHNKHQLLVLELININKTLLECDKYERRNTVNRLVVAIDTTIAYNCITLNEEYRDYISYKKKKLLENESQANILLLESLIIQLKENEERHLYLELKNDNIKEKYDNALNGLKIIKAQNRMMELNYVLIANNLRSNIEYVKAKIDLSILEDTNKIVEYTNQINRYKEIISNCQTEKYNKEYADKCNNNVILLSHKIKEYEINKSNYSTLLTQYEVNEKNLLLCNEYVRLFSAGGVPNNILSNKIILFESIIQEIAGQFIKYKIHVVNKKNKMSILFDEFNVEHLSGYEKLIIRIAINQAVIVLGNCNRGKLLIIDESLDCIDNTRFNEELPVLINMIKKYYTTVILISHRNITDDIVDQNIKITHSNGNSCIKL